MHDNLKTQTRDAIDELGQLKETYRTQSSCFVYEVTKLEKLMNEEIKNMALQINQVENVLEVHKGRHELAKTKHEELTARVEKAEADLIKLEADTLRIDKDKLNKDIFFAHKKKMELRYLD